MWKQLHRQFTENYDAEIKDIYRSVYLKPCEMYIEKDPALISTVLGSCISVAMFWVKAQVGGMSHAMLPSSGLALNSQDTPFYSKFVDSSIFYMHKRFQMWGASITDIEVKVFGGADMFASNIENPKRETVGAKNIQSAFRILDNLGYKITAQDVGGKNGRKMFFYSSKGQVFVKNLRTMRDR